MRPSSVRSTVVSIAVFIAACSGSDTKGSTPTIPTPPALSLDGAVPPSVIVGAPQTTILLNGKGFTPASRARWNGADRPTTYLSDRQLQMVVTDTDLGSAQIVDVTVQNGTTEGSSNVLSFTVANPRPSLQSISPDNAFSGTGIVVIELTGSRFLPTSQVSVNGIVRTPFFGGSTRLLVSATDADVETAKTFSIVVTNPAPGGGTSESATFTVKQSPPGIRTLSPASAGVGDSLEMVIFGANFLPGMVVQWNGVVKETTYWSSIRLSTMVNPQDLSAIGTAQVRIVDRATGTGSDPATFTIIPFSPPLVTSLSPSLGFIGSPGLTLTVRGGKFRAGMVVTMNGAVRPTSFVSASTLTTDLTAADLAAPRAWSVGVLSQSSNQSSNAASFLAVYQDPPIPPVPSGLWEPPAGDAPATGTFLYLQSETGDIIGGGKTQLFTGPSGLLEPSRTLRAALDFGIGGWRVDLSTMAGVLQFRRGYYANAQLDPPFDPAVPGLLVSEGLLCNTIKGWFVLDEVTYLDGKLKSFSGRFEQHCYDMTPALRGAFRWVG